MKVCNYCGVELDVEMNYCPLCGHKSNSKVVQGGKDIYKGLQNVRMTDFNFDELTQRQKRKLVWELATFVLLLTSVVTLIIDLLTSKHITWSKYTMTVGLSLLIDVTFIILLEKRMLLIFVGCFISTSLLLFLLDIYTRNIDNGLTIGVPILFFIFIVLFLLAILIQQTKQKGINIIGYSLVAAGIICMCIEGIITLHILRHLQLHWSLFVVVSVIPVSAILLYIQHRLKRATDLKKIFHI